MRRAGSLPIAPVLTVGDAAGIGAESSRAPRRARSGARDRRDRAFARLRAGLVHDRAMNRIYFTARFVSSASDPRQCPEAVAEVAFAGRSNAGKSSALNALTRNAKLARTSRTPGRTQLINHFAVGEEGHFLVDLPGYGYAKVSRERQRAWQRALLAYLGRREALRGLVLVMDIRHPLQPVDWELLELHADTGLPLHCLLTKADKVSRGERARTLSRVRRELEEHGVEATLQDFSSTKGEGIDDAHAVLDHWLFGAPLDAGELEDEAG